MRKSYLLYTVAVFALLAITTQSCKKVDGINNNSVIETPYSLYYSDSSGALYNTNNGTTAKPMVFPPDGYSCRAICVSGNNLLWLKERLYISTNNGTNFNPTYDSVPQLVGLNQYYVAYQSAILDVPDQNRVYVSTFGGIGVAYNEKNGAKNNWMIDTAYDHNDNNVNNAAIVSFTELKNHVLVGYDVNNRILAKNSSTSRWLNRTGTNSSTNLPLSFFTLGHYNNTLVAIDYNGVYGAYYSNDTGKTWAPFAGLPAGRRLYAVASPFDQVLLVGTDSAGVYRLNGGMFVPANNGLEDYTSVRAIVGKEDIYKNDNTSQKYVYIATSKGLYQSVDMGQNWIQVQKGNFVAAY